jgi:hypothetical protein
MDVNLATLKSGLVLFWAAWLTIVCLTNILAGLKALGILPEGWKFASGNYQAVLDTVSTYSWPAWSAGLLFLGVIAWQALAVFLFWRAFLGSGAGAVVAAFAASLGLWAAFMLADERTKSLPRIARKARTFCSLSPSY